MNKWKEFLDNYNTGLVSLKEITGRLKNTNMLNLGNCRYIRTEDYISAYIKYLLDNIIRLMSNDIYHDYNNNFDKVFEIWSKYIRFHSTLLFDHFEVEIPKISINDTNKSIDISDSKYIHHKPINLNEVFYKESTDKGVAVKVDIIKSRTTKHSNRGN